MSGGSRPDVKTTTQSGTSSGTTSGTASGTTTQVLSPEQQQLLGFSMPFLQQFAATGAPTPQVAGFTPTQLAAQQEALGGVAPLQRGVTEGAAGAVNRFTSGEFLDPNTNPALAGTIRAATRPIFEGLTEEALPAIRDEARLGGANIGSSRRGIAEGIATGKATRQAGDVGERIAFQSYQQNLDNMLRAAGLAPATAGAAAIPAATVGAVGDVEQAQRQRELDALIAAQFGPLLTGSTLAGIAGGLPGGGVTSTGQTFGQGTGFTSGTGQTVGTAPQTSPFQTILGLGSLAGGLLGTGGLSSLTKFL